MPKLLKMAPELKEQIFQEAYHDRITPKEMVKRHNLTLIDIRSILMIMKSPLQKLPKAYRFKTIAKAVGHIQSGPSKREGGVGHSTVALV